MQENGHTVTRALVCGATRISAEVLKRMGAGWHVTLVDPATERLTDFSTRFELVQRVVEGDPSSPVVLEEAGLADQAFVLAMTCDDRVNLAVARFARDQEVKHIMALLNDSENQPDFDDLGQGVVRTVAVSALPARHVYRYLRNPGVQVATVADGQGEVIEVDVGRNHRVVDRPIKEVRAEHWTVVALFRGGRLHMPAEDTVVQAGDRLIFLGLQDIYDDVCSLLECEEPSFPLDYGQSLLLGMPPDADPDALFDEAVHLAQNTMVQNVVVACRQDPCPVQQRLDEWSHTLEMAVRGVEGEMVPAVQDLCAQENVGLVVLPPRKESFFRTLTRPTLTALAHSLPAPLLVARGSFPYGRLLVPFNGTEPAQRSLDVALDLARQLKAAVTVVVVREPGFVHGDEERAREDWHQQVLARARDAAHVHKVQLHEEVREGNPVHEILELADDHDLMVLANPQKDKELFTPNVGEELAAQAPCSVLLVVK
jgi:Trk K+ transport system NAD-binding subunit/nucleotide-binding universal stress UspA family protein